MNTDIILHQNVKKLYLHYLLPTLIALLSNSMYCLADVYFIAQGAGSNGLAALNIAMPVFSLFASIGMTLGVGGATIMAIAEGNRHDKLRNKAFSLSIYTMVFIGLILCIGGAIFIEPLAYAFGSSKELLPEVVAYLLPTMLCSIFFILMYSSSILMRSDHAPRTAMIATLVGNISNIILDYIFVIVFKQGVLGASVATCIGAILVVVCMSSHFFRHQNSVYFTKDVVDFSLWKRMVKNGLGSGLMEISVGTVTIVFNFVILRYADAVFLAAFAIVTNIAYVCKGLLNGFAQAAQPILSVNYGARAFQRVKEGLKISLQCSMIFAITLYALLFFFPDFVASLFANGDVALISKAAQGIRLYFSSLIFSAVITMLLYYFQSIEKGNYASFIAICKGFLFVLIGLCLLMYLFGLNGIWLTMSFAEALSVCLGIYFMKRVGREI
ncbi:MAG: MATE family efflux transporter [Longicatena sp.]